MSERLGRKPSMRTTPTSQPPMTHHGRRTTNLPHRANIVPRLPTAACVAPRHTSPAYVVPTHQSRSGGAGATSAQPVHRNERTETGCEATPGKLDTEGDRMRSNLRSHWRG